MVGIEPTYDKQTLLTTRFTLCLCLTPIRIMPLTFTMRPYEQHRLSLLSFSFPLLMTYTRQTF